jgi:hypothetical protein
MNAIGIHSVVLESCVIVLLVIGLAVFINRKTRQEDGITKHISGHLGAF